MSYERGFPYLKQHEFAAPAFYLGVSWGQPLICGGEVRGFHNRDKSGSYSLWAFRSLRNDIQSSSKSDLKFECKHDIPTSFGRRQELGYGGRCQPRRECIEIINYINGGSDQ